MFERIGVMEETDADVVGGTDGDRNFSVIINIRFRALVGGVLDFSEEASASFEDERLVIFDDVIMCCAGNEEGFYCGGGLSEEEFGVTDRDKLEAIGATNTTPPHALRAAQCTTGPEPIDRPTRIIFDGSTATSRTRYVYAAWMSA